LKKFLSRYYLYGLFFVVLLLFIRSIWDGYTYIGGDVMIPLHPGNALQKIFLWNNGRESFGYISILWFAFYYLFFCLGLSGFVAQKILLVVLLVMGFVFTALTYRELFRGTRYDTSELRLLAATVFTLNPIYFLLCVTYTPLYGFPVCFYFLLKFLRHNKMSYAFLFSFFLNFLFFTDLPQPKLLIVFFIASLGLCYVYRQLNGLSVKDVLLRFGAVFLMSALLNLWVWIPLFYSFFFGAVGNFSKDIITSGGNAEHGIATLVYIMRFFNLVIIKYYSSLKPFLTGVPFVFWSFGQWIIIAWGTFFVFKEKRFRNVSLALLAFILFFIFIAKGSNPPLGGIFRYAVLHLPLVRVFRTTSSVVIGAVVFYAFLFTMAVCDLSKKKRWPIVAALLANMIVFYPIYLGYKFYNPLTYAAQQKGFLIPQAYYELGRYLDVIKEDSKVLSSPLNNGYVQKQWQYFGPDILTWITNKPMITLERQGDYGFTSRESDAGPSPGRSYRSYALNNVGYLLVQKDSVGGTSVSTDGLSQKDLLVQNDYFDFYKIDERYFLPHVYFSFMRPMAVDDIKMRPLIDDALRISFARVNPTKYVINVSHASSPFWLVFNEPFSRHWKLYKARASDAKARFFEQTTKYYPSLHVREARHRHDLMPTDLLYLFTATLNERSGRRHANVWYIEPDKLGLGEDFTLVVFYWPQALFYLGLVISVLAAAAVFIFKITVPAVQR